MDVFAVIILVIMLSGFVSGEVEGVPRWTF